MHELSICSAIADIVTRKVGSARVDTIHLEVGQLRQIVPGTLEYCWGLVSAETTLAGSRIAVERIPAAITCRACGEAMPIGDLPVFRCAQCNGVDVEVVAGEEFQITSLDLAKD